MRPSTSFRSPCNHKLGADDRVGKPEGYRVFIEGLPHDCDDSDLADLVTQIISNFRSHDRTLLDCHVVNGRGCGYLEFSSHEAAVEAIDGFDERQVNGWPEVLSASWARPTGEVKDRNADRENDHEGYRDRGRERKPSRRGSSHVMQDSPRGMKDHRRGERGVDDDPGTSQNELRRIFVGQLQASCDYASINKVFQEFGRIVELRVLNTKGIAYIIYSCESDANRAVRAMNGAVVPNISRGEGLNVQIAKPKK